MSNKTVLPLLPGDAGITPGRFSSHMMAIYRFYSLSFPFLRKKAIENLIKAIRADILYLCRFENTGNTLVLAKPSELPI